MSDTSKSSGQLNGLASTVSAAVKPVVQRAYDDVLRPHLPRTWCVYGSIPAKDNRLLDATDYKPNYKQGLTDAIQRHVGSSDDVVVVGGGRGVSTVYCARQGATVTAFEAGEEMTAIARQTVAMQGVADRVAVRHAVVGPAVDVFGDMGDPESIRPADLDAGDVLVLDCEGAETSICKRLTDCPRVIIAETHPGCGAPTPVVSERLTAMDYDVTERQYEPGHDGDKRVLVGVR